MMAKGGTGSASQPRSAAMTRAPAGPAQPEGQEEEQSERSHPAEGARAGAGHVADRCGRCDGHGRGEVGDHGVRPVGCGAKSSGPASSRSRRRGQGPALVVRLPPPGLPEAQPRVEGLGALVGLVDLDVEDRVARPRVQHERASDAPAVRRRVHEQPADEAAQEGDEAHGPTGQLGHADRGRGHVVLAHERRVRVEVGRVNEGVAHLGRPPPDGEARLEVAGGIVVADEHRLAPSSWTPCGARIPISGPARHSSGRAGPRKKAAAARRDRAPPRGAPRAGRLSKAIRVQGTGVDPDEGGQASRAALRAMSSMSAR
jgi:hypothetical protein